jgi:hypothetical protein
VDGLPVDPATYASFVAQVAERYRDKVEAIEVWFWPNIWYEVGRHGWMNAANYVQLLQQSYQAIKVANPKMMVISGAMSPAGNVGDLAIDDTDYLRQMYAHGVKGYFDALGANPSGYNCPALADWQTVTPEEASADPQHGLFTNLLLSPSLAGASVITLNPATNTPATTRPQNGLSGLSRRINGPKSRAGSARWFWGTWITTFQSRIIFLWLTSVSSTRLPTTRWSTCRNKAKFQVHLTVSGDKPIIKLLAHSEVRLNRINLPAVQSDSLARGRFECKRD